MSNNESFTTEEIAQLLKVSKLTVYDLIKKGQLQAYRVGRQMRIDAKELENYKTRKTEVKTTTTHTSAPQSTATATRPIVISGQDNSLDMLTHQLEARTSNYRPLRSYAGSLNSLIAMYKGQADIVSTHLLDGDTLEYNISYVRKLLVSQSFVIIKFISRQAGLYVPKGNLKKVSSWEDFKRPTITIVNREVGAGARILVDEQLRIHGIKKEEIKGYEHVETSHLAVASAVASGRADIGVGIEQTAKLATVDFIPMITESYDLVILKTVQNMELIDHILHILKTELFQEKLRSLGNNIDQIGEIIFEQ